MEREQQDRAAAEKERREREERDRPPPFRRDGVNHNGAGGGEADGGPGVARREFGERGGDRPKRLFDPKQNRWENRKESNPLIDMRR